MKAPFSSQAFLFRFLVFRDTKNNPAIKKAIKEDCIKLIDSCKIKKARRAETGTSKDHIGSTTESFPCFRASKSRRAATKSMAEAPMTKGICGQYSENKAGISLYTKGSKTIAPKRVIRKSVSQFPNFRVDF